MKEKQRDPISEIPQEFKLELKTPLETFFMWAAIISVFVIIGSLRGLGSAASFNSKLMLAVGCLSLTVFASLYFSTDNYYIVDITGERILYHFRFFFIRKVSTVCSFKQISLITTGGKRQKSKNTVWWEYAVYMLTTDGKLLQLSDNLEGAFDDQKDAARKLCDITGARFIDAPEERIVRAAGLNCVRHEAHTIIDTFVEIGTILLIIGITLAILATLGTFWQPLLKMLENAGK